MHSIFMIFAIIFLSSFLPVFLLVDRRQKQWTKIGALYHRYTPIFNSVVKMGKGRWQLAFEDRNHFHVVQMVEMASNVSNSELSLVAMPAGTKEFSATIKTANSSHTFIRNGNGYGIFWTNGTLDGKIHVYYEDNKNEVEEKQHNSARKNEELWFFEAPPIEFVNVTGITTVKTIFYESSDYINQLRCTEIEIESEEVDKKNGKPISEKDDGKRMMCS